MSFDPTPEEQELLADTFARGRTTLSRRELLAGALVGAGMLAAVAAMWIVQPVGSIQTLPAVLTFAVLVAANRVSFDTPFGFTGLTQIAFVPMLFAMPLPLVPLAAALALALAGLPEALKRELPPLRLLGALGNSWFAVGPALVFVLAHTAPSRAGALLLIGALLAEFAADFVASCLRFRIARGASLATQLRDTWVYTIDAALSGVGLVLARRVHSEPVAVLALVPLLGLFAVLARERHQRLQSLLELGSAYRGTALVLGDVVEADDGYTGQHCRSVVRLALEVADGIGLQGEPRRNLEFAALLHDVGKIAIPKEIINKPGKLDAHEWEIVKQHTIEGQRMLERVGGFMREVGVIVRAHHERWDGAGYPDGLPGERIPLEARIIACCDSWNAMRTNRAYRAALSHEVALAELVDCSGTQFDPRVVEALLPVVRSEAELDSGVAARRRPRSELLSDAMQPAG